VSLDTLLGILSMKRDAVAAPAIPAPTMQPPITSPVQAPQSREAPASESVLVQLTGAANVTDLWPQGIFLFEDGPSPPVLGDWSDAACGAIAAGVLEDG
jgi:hypothetical protein